MATVPQILQSEFSRLGPSTADDVPRSVDALVAAVISSKFSDLHLVPFPEGLTLLGRREGVLQPLGQWPSAFSVNVVSRLKVMADLLTYRSDIPQEGRLRKAPAGVEVRIASFPTIHGEKAVLRLFVGSGKYKELPDLGFVEELRDEIDRLLWETSGVLLIAGPAGSGKTTTAYACLRAIMAQSVQSRSVVTIEDPVEAVLPGIAQSQIQPAAGFTYETGLKSLLRQDPDVILVGEVRDPVTAGTVFQAALTGHLVVSTFHAGSAAEGVFRLVDLGVEPFVLRSALLATVCQRLVRKLCECALWSTSLEDRWGLPVERCRRVVGCAKCRDTGFDGRIPLAELLDPARHNIGRSLLQNADANLLATAAMRNGFIPLQGRGEFAVTAGLTSASEILRVLGARRRITPTAFVGDIAPAVPQQEESI